MNILLSAPLSLPASAMEFALSTGIKCTVLLTLVWLVTTIWRRGSASVRHAVLGSAVLAMLIIPVASLLLPVWQVASVPDLSPTTAMGSAHQTLRATDKIAMAGTFSPEQTSVGITETDAATAQSPEWSVMVLIVWLGGTGLLLARLLLGIIRTARLVGRAHDIDATRSVQTLQRCADRLGVKRRVRIVLSRETRIPFVWGWWRPVAVLPQNALNWSNARLQTVLLHELAHIRGHDTLLSLLTGVVTALYWFNPLVWALAHKLYLEQERACDDCVIMAGTDACEYAGQLLEMSDTSNTNTVPVPSAALAGGTQLGDRIVRIINTKQKRTRVSAIKLVIITTLTLGLTLPLASITGKPEVDMVNVSAAEYAAASATLSSFYEAMNEGEDYEYIRESFLSADYFDNTALTLENTDRTRWRAAFENVIQVISTEGLSGPFTAETKIISVRRQDDRYFVTQRLTLTGDKFIIDSVIETSEGITLKTARDPQTGEPLKGTSYLVRDLEHEVVLTVENGEWKIARYNDGLTIGRMDVNSRYGPIYLIWLDDLGSAITPYGEFVSKVIPSWNRPFNNGGITFSLVE